VIDVALPGACVRFTGRAGGDLREGAARAGLEEAIGRPVAHGRQVHGAHVRRLGEEMSGEQADGQATGRTDVAPLVLVADCLPIALAGPGAVAMVHAGWRGLAGGVVEAGVRAVRELGGEGPLAAAIGPGAGPCCYEVGDEVHAALGTSGPTADLKAVARGRLAAAGVEAVQDVGVCTICDERFFSYRREGAAAGRQGGAAWRA
jgi:YfiH family protein